MIKDTIKWWSRRLFTSLLIIILFLLMFIFRNLINTPMLVNALQLPSTSYTPIKFNPDSFKNDNLIYLNVNTNTINGVTWISEDGVITLNGTTTNSGMIINGVDILTNYTLLNGEYSFKIFTNNDGYHNSDLAINFVGNNGINDRVLFQNMAPDSNIEYTQTIDNYNTFYFQVYVNANVTFNNFQIKPMLIKGRNIEEYQVYNPIGFSGFISNVGHISHNTIYYLNKDTGEKIYGIRDYYNNLVFPNLCPFKLNELNYLYSDCKDLELNVDSIGDNKLYLTGTSQTIEFMNYYVGNLYGFVFSDNTNYFGANASGGSSTEVNFYNSTKFERLLIFDENKYSNIKNIDLSFSAIAIGNNINNYVQDLPNDNDNNTYEQYNSCSAWYDIPCQLGNGVTFVLYNVPIISPLLQLLKSMIDLINNIVTMIKWYEGLGIVFSLFIFILLIRILIMLLKGSNDDRGGKK